MQIYYREVLFKDGYHVFGSHGWTRTNDQMINSHLRYRLRYAGILSANLF